VTPYTPPAALASCQDNGDGTYTATFTQPVTVTGSTTTDTGTTFSGPNPDANPSAAAQTSSQSITYSGGTIAAGATNLAVDPSTTLITSPSGFTASSCAITPYTAPQAQLTACADNGDGTYTAAFNVPVYAYGPGTDPTIAFDFSGTPEYPDTASQVAPNVVTLSGSALTSGADQLAINGSPSLLESPTGWTNSSVPVT
jgi:hypothetical protein